MPWNSVHSNKLFGIRKRIKCNLLHMLRHLIDCHVHAAISFVFFSVVVRLSVHSVNTRNQWFIGVFDISHKVRTKSSMEIA